jgi:hypothetical protein
MYFAVALLQLCCTATLCAASLPDLAAASQAVVRDFETVGIPVAVGTGGFTYGTGHPNRDCDHATVAMNENRDVVVAYQAFRHEGPNDLPPKGPATYMGQMKQVEVAFYEYKPTPQGEDAWQHLETRVIGGVEQSPIAGLNQILVRCERPDVVAVGDKFFVVWTRRYHHSNKFPNQSTEPGVLECAWIEKQQTPDSEMVVYADPGGAKGLGYILDMHDLSGSRSYEILDCGGVADAVPLVDHDPSKLEVAIVYTHQTLFGVDLNSQREFTLRVATCQFDLASNQITHETNYPPLWTEVPFHGRPSPSTVSPGLTLPDLAASSEERAFWMAHEQQKMKQVSPTAKAPNGRIQLEYYRFKPSGTQPPGVWERKGKVMFNGEPGEATWRRRPMLSSYPWDTQRRTVSLAFIKVRSGPTFGDGSSNIHYQEWDYNGDDIHEIPSRKLFPITDDDHYWIDRPVPLMGSNTSPFRRCYYTRGVNMPGRPVPTDLVFVNALDFPGKTEAIDSDANTHHVDLLRPAVDYRFFPGAADPHCVVTTWEKRGLHGALRIYIGFE